jgi:hypothetical protein
MPKKACCCPGAPIPPGVTGSFCCNPLFFTDFITLYGDDMADHAEVSPYDWIGLVVNRPGIGTSDFIRSNTQPVTCNCCCGDCSSPLTENSSLSEPINSKPIKKFFNSFTHILQSKKSDQSYNLKKLKDVRNEKFEAYKSVNKDGDNTLVEDVNSDLNFEKIKKIDQTLLLDNSTPHSSQLPKNFNGSTPCNFDVRYPPDTDDPEEIKAHALCTRTCCKIEKYQSSVEGSLPIFFAYKYSGCNFIWYPREFTFDKDPYVSQCTGFKTWQKKCNQDGSNCEFFAAQNSCSGWATQRFSAGSPSSAYFVEECEYPVIYQRETDAAFPCACAPFPHIHGGVRDSVFNRINVRLSEYQLGYVSKMYPFSEPMIGEYEAGCCWCANTAFPDGADWDNYKAAKKACFRATYPFFDQRGKRPGILSPCEPGLRCHYRYQTQDGGYGPEGGAPDAYMGNPNYRRHCYEWGISPYLLRISTKYYRTGLEIFKHGRYGDYKHDYGVVFDGAKVETNDLDRELQIQFKRKLGKKSSLREQYIGFVQLEHHFECYAFRSEEGTRTIEMAALLNNCRMLIGPFERGYGGVYTERQNGGIYRWTPWDYDSTLWQIKRGVPRRVMYAGSGVPLFHFDLIRMENLCASDASIGTNCEPFTAERFLSDYYRYFYGLIYWTGLDCTDYFRPSEPIEWDYTHFVSSYNYVKCWLEQMVVHGILRIKDHAIDIAKETNDVIAAGSYAIDPDTGNAEIVIPDAVATECGGFSGYTQLLNFWGVCAGAQNSITPKLVKDKLYNPNGAPEVDPSPGFQSTINQPMRLFLPRRARLPLGAVFTGITAWGCTGGFSAQNNYEGITCPSYVGPNNPNGSVYGNSLEIPEILTVTDPEGPLGVYSLLRPSDVYTNLSGTILKDISGKISIFGGIPFGEEENDPYTSGDRACGEPNDIFTGIFGLYPSSIACIPVYLGIQTLFAGGENNEIIPANGLDIWDGRVQDVCFTHKFAVAMVEFDRQAFGAPCFAPAQGELPTNPAYEAAEFSIFYPDYNSLNCNGSNTTYTFPTPGSPMCLINEPFHMVPYTGGDLPGPRTVYPDPPYRGNRLKSWGSWSALIGTFSMAYEDAVYYSSDNLTPFETSRDIPRRCYDPNIHGVTFDKDGNEIQLNYRYPGTNTWHIWTKIGCGLYHFAALDDHGGLFITPNSSNSENQSEHGIPLQYNSRWNRVVGSNWNYEGFGSFFNYYNHIPRPGFIKSEEWSQSVYNRLTAFTSFYRQRHCVCATFVSDPLDIPSYCAGTPHGGGGVGGGGGPEPPCKNCRLTDITIPATDPITNEYGCGNCYGPGAIGWRDLSCYLLGSYVQGGGFDSINHQPPNNAFYFGFKDSQPRYTDLACGAFNTMLLTNENKIEMHGTFLQINENGTVIGPKIYENQDGVEVPVLQPIPCFVPADVQNLAGTWDVTYGCPIFCESAFTEEGEVDYEGKLLEPCWSGCTFSPVVEATYTPPNLEDRIKIIKSSADYALCVTNGNKVYVWGEVSMVPTKYNKDNYIPGQSASVVLNEVNLGAPLGANMEITNVAVGIHAFYITFKVILPNTSFTVNKVYSYSRYGNETFGLSTPDYLQNKEITSIASGNGFAVAIYGEGFEAKTWDANSFAVESRVAGWDYNHLNYQYKDFASLPPFYRRDAFFHAIPGNWDFSKWLYGGNCCSVIENPDHPALQIDTCSALAYNVYLDPGLLGVEYKAVSDSYLQVKPNRPDDPLVGPGMTLVNLNVIDFTTGFTYGQWLNVYANMSPVAGFTLSFEGTVTDFKSHTYDANYTLSLQVTNVIWYPLANGEWIPELNSAGGSSENDVWIIEVDKYKIFNSNMSRSGHPELLWMRSDIRRSTQQAFDQFKNQAAPEITSGPGPEPSETCVPDGVTDLSGRDTASLAGLYGSCLRDIGPCWGENRPMASRAINGQQLAFPPCATGNICDPPEYRFKNRGIVCDSIDPPCPVLSTGFEVPTPQAYRADKDVFQKIYHRYGPTRIGDEICREHTGYSQSYFKYCERHYYLGHDLENDTWEIYETPDIFRDYSATIIEGNTFCTFGDEPPCSVTGATLSYPGNSGFGQGSCGYESLSGYPRTGPNYTRRDWVLYPDTFISSWQIASTIVFNTCAALYPDFPCDTSTCAGQGYYASNRIFNILKHGGIGALVWGSACNGNGLKFCGDADCNSMWNNYLTYNQLFRTLTPTELLWGARTNIDPIIPPDEDGNFEKKGFLKVLVDPQYTAMYEPFRDTSNKWHPLCWESRSDYPSFGIINADVNCFAGSELPIPGSDSDSNLIRLDPPPLLNGYGAPATCVQQECCPPPD